MADHRLRRRIHKISTSVLPLSDVSNPLHSGHHDVLLADRRQSDSPRFRQQLTAKVSSLALTSDPLVVGLDAVVINASRGGIGLWMTWPLPISSCVRCELSFADDRFRIPTLMQVRWINTSDDDNYFCGLQYLV